MKRIIFIFILLIASVAHASPPSRQNSYVSGDTIKASDVTDNEDAIFNYLQAGVDTIKDGVIVNADVSTTANIQSSKVNLQAISQSVANTGTFTNTGDATFSAKVTMTGLVATQSIKGDTYYSGDNSQGITDDTSYWICTANDCSSFCQLTIKDGLITACN